MAQAAFDRRLLPPTAALRSFEAAARLESFTLAAHELNITQGAVSRQVKYLEQLLKVTLFERANQRVILTDAGRYYAQHVAESLGYLVCAAQQTISFANPAGQLHIGIVPAFAARWIVPRLPQFMALHPRLQLRLSTVKGGSELTLDQHDAALVVGRGAWTNAISHQLAAEELVAVASPAWLKQHQVKTAQELIGPPLIMHAARPNLWSRWFALNGVTAGALAPMVLTLEDIAMMIEAAANGLGAALLPRALISRELDARDLAIVKGKALHVSDGFHLVYAQHRASHEPLAAFRNWLLGAN